MSPLLRAAAGDDPDIGSCLARKTPTASEPFLHTVRPGIVGGSRKSQIAKLAAQLLEPPRGLVQRLNRLEWVGQTPPAGCSRHELRNALRAGPTDRGRIEAALLPDQPREELRGQVVLQRSPAQFETQHLGKGPRRSCRIRD